MKKAFVARTREREPICVFSIGRRGRVDAHITIFPEAAAGALIANPPLDDGTTGADLREKPPLGTKPSLGGMAFALADPSHFGNFAGW